MKDLITQLTLIFIGIGTIVGSNLLSPALEIIKQSYPGASPLLLPMVVTLPALTSLLGLAMASTLNRTISAKKLIIFGLFLFTFGGIIPAVLTNLYLILICRALVGIGFGMIIPLQTQMFSTYPEKTCARLIGLNTTLNCVAGVVLITIAGNVAAIDWHNIFYLYAIGIVLLVLSMIFLPNTPPVSSQFEEAETVQTKNKMPKIVYIYCAFIALVTLLTYTNTIVASSYVIETGLGNLAEASMLISIGTILSAVGGLIMPKVDSIFKSKTMPMLTIIMAIGFVIFGFPKAFIFLAMGQTLVYLVTGLTTPWATFKITQTVSYEHVAPACSLLMGTVFVCQFLTPYFYQTISSILSLSNFSPLFIVYAILSAIATIFVLKVK